MITLEWKEDGLTPMGQFADTPLGKAVIETEDETEKHHLYLGGVWLGDNSSVALAKERLQRHLEAKTRELLGEGEPVSVTRESLVREMTTLAQGQYDSGAQAALQVIEAAFREAAKVHPDTMVSFNDAVTFVLAIKAEVFK